MIAICMQTTSVSDPNPSAGEKNASSLATSWRISDTAASRSIAAAASASTLSLPFPLADKSSPFGSTDPLVVFVPEECLASLAAIVRGWAFASSGRYASNICCAHRWATITATKSAACQA